ncbi:hypothetical protein B9Z55_003069 [Caenorhabditis nigoni]|uniref:Uncharacterized protein n=1 Tax=Caenorhabditis nigoni TaxID=1611254 RepID=A0A2G5VNG2_9PELO|nr:hypothetical protein B9Z55_003069 [Caenorhabditis nigoni]
MRWNRPLSTALVLLALVIYSTDALGNGVAGGDDDYDDSSSTTTTTETPIETTRGDDGEPSSSTTEKPDPLPHDPDTGNGEPSSSTTEASIQTTEFNYIDWLNGQKGGNNNGGSGPTESTLAAEDTTTTEAAQPDVTAANDGVETTPEDSGVESTENPDDNGGDGAVETTSTENPTDPTPASTDSGSPDTTTTENPDDQNVPTVQAAVDPVDTTTTEDPDSNGGNGAGVGGQGGLGSVITTSTEDTNGNGLPDTTQDPNGNAPTDPTTVDDSNVQTSTEQAVGNTDTPDNGVQRQNQGQQTGRDYTVIPLSDDVKDKLPQPTKATYKDAEGNEVKLEDLDDDFQILSANGVALPNNIVANKHGLYRLHPVQTNRKSVMYDPETIGMVLGYLYELNEFGPNGPDGGFTINLLYDKATPPLKFKRSNGQKTRRGTLVFTKKAEVVAEEKYWKQFMSSI